jgi:hypothetical protein
MTFPPFSTSSARLTVSYVGLSAEDRPDSEPFRMRAYNPMRTYNHARMNGSSADEAVIAATT